MKTKYRSPTSGRYAANRNFLKIQCELCPTTEQLQVHHKDRDATNNTPDNLQTLCKVCHRQVHVDAGDWGRGRPPVSTCEICKTSFQPKRRTRSVLCGSAECHAEKSKRSGSKKKTKKLIGATPEIESL